jgi:hypothetical protein
MVDVTNTVDDLAKQAQAGVQQVAGEINTEVKAVEQTVAQDVAITKSDLAALEARLMARYNAGVTIVTTTFTDFSKTWVKVRYYFLGGLALGLAIGGLIGYAVH